MSEDTLTVEARELLGKRNSKRLRAAGKVPAVLYGHGQPSVALAVDRKQLAGAIRSNAHLLKLSGAASESALLKDVQWDAFGSNVLHVDLTRVDENELVEVEVRVKLRGEAPGVKQGGVVTQTKRIIQIISPAIAIPDGLELKISELDLGQSLTAGDIPLPDKVELKSDPAMVMVTCTEPTVATEEDETAAAADGAEPEVIGGAKEDEAEGGGDS